MQGNNGIMQTPWINGFAIVWSSVCGCSEKCYHYSLFQKVNGRTRILKRFFGIKKNQKIKLSYELVKYFILEYGKTKS